MLTVPAGLDGLHQQAFGRGENAVVAQIASGRSGPDGDAFEQPLATDERLVGQQEGFGQEDTAVGGVIERAFEQVEGTVVPGDTGQGRKPAG